MNHRFAPAPFLQDSGPAGSSYAVRPAWGLLGIVVGTAVALLLVPADHYRPGALAAPVLAMVAGLLVGPVLSGLRNPLTAFRTEHLVMLGLVYWIFSDAVQAGNRLWDVSKDTVEHVFLYTGVFAGFVWAGSSLANLAFAPHAVARERPDVGPGFLFRAGVACFVLGCSQALVTCRFSPGCLVDAFYAPRFDTPWFEGGLKGFNTVLANLRYFGFLTLPIAVALWQTQRRIDVRVVVLGVLAALFMLLLIRDGGRKDVGCVIGAALLVWVLLRPSLKLQHVAIVVGTAVCLVLVMQFMEAWRTVGIGKAFRSDAPRRQATIVVDRSIDWLAHVVEVVPRHAPHTGWTGVAYIVGYPIPRSIWPSKPVQRGLELPRLINREYARGFSWNCTAVGDFYLIGGALMVCVGGLLYGVGANLASRLLFRRPTARSRLLYAAIAMTLFLSLRAVWELTAQGMTIAAVWMLLAMHLPDQRAWRSQASVSSVPSRRV